MFNEVTAIAFWVMLASLPLGVSVAYFCASPPTQSLSQRLATCAHGASISALWIAALLICFFGLGAESNWSVFGPVRWLPFALVIYSLWRYAGTRWMHLLQLINVAWLLAFLGFGRLVVTVAWV